MLSFIYICTPLDLEPAQYVTSCYSNLSFFQQGSSAANSNAPSSSAVACITLHRLLPDPAISVTTYQQPANSPWHPHSIQAQFVADVTRLLPTLPRSDTRGGVICPTERSPTVDCWCTPAVAEWTTGANKDDHRDWLYQLMECRQHEHYRDTSNQKCKKKNKRKWFQSSLTIN